MNVEVRKELPYSVVSLSERVHRLKDGDWCNEGLLMPSSRGRFHRECLEEEVGKSGEMFQNMVEHSVERSSAQSPMASLIESIDHRLDGRMSGRTIKTEIEDYDEITANIFALGNDQNVDAPSTFGGDLNDGGVGHSYGENCISFGDSELAHSSALQRASAGFSIDRFLNAGGT
ncbi:unnamed protein product, partial [Toxocara canis]|uniref:CACTA en-spm transposon protein n=1 Tax=Toxocara canis TaxID=6265 RepID=A0A183TYU3_TOXCA